MGQTSQARRTHALVRRKTPCQTLVRLLPTEVLADCRTKAHVWMVRSSRTRRSLAGAVDVVTFFLLDTAVLGAWAMTYFNLQANLLPRSSVMPNPSLKLTRYGRLCKPGPHQSYYRREPGLQSLPPRAA